jgi:hypothetical protein
MSGVHTPYVHLLCKTTTWSSWQQQSRVRREVQRFSMEVKRPTVEAEDPGSNLLAYASALAPAHALG